MPNANYIKKARVGVCVGSVMVRIMSVRLFGNQHVGISNVNRSCWGTGYVFNASKQQGNANQPNARGFAFWWNIGLILPTDNKTDL